ncbi:hypothetical protein Vadar_023947 [Vaccinium darrowii]|uniref:Uncharacterized protein n=1 Tax=Vaccinium darrowii TaxID=229202 RepID=A0ACB7YZR6_9ERIC|nr:hypothetical protein Vadar_023947 [Vaccinium darrowii]
MSTTLSQLFDLQEQICYVQCLHCTTILLVSVPRGSLTMVVTPKQEVSPHEEEEEGAEDADQKALDKRSPSPVISLDIDDDEDEDDFVPVNHIVHRPPGKKQRAPSAYNFFIKEEIRRLKNEYPNMTHKEAFSAAAKNWAHFPPTHYKKDGETSCCGQGADQRKMPRSSDVGEVRGNDSLTVMS